MDLVRMLVHVGASKDLTDVDGVSPWELADGDEDMKRLLSEPSTL